MFVMQSWKLKSRYGSIRWTVSQWQVERARWYACSFSRKCAICNSYWNRRERNTSEQFPDKIVLWGVEIRKQSILLNIYDLHSFWIRTHSYAIQATIVLNIYSNKRAFCCVKYIWINIYICLVWLGFQICNGRRF